MWSKVVENISRRSGVLEFTTHTSRHLCLTDLARANWDIHEIAPFAGHRSIQTTLIYIHLCGRELAAKLARGVAETHPDCVSPTRWTRQLAAAWVAIEASIPLTEQERAAVDDGVEATQKLLVLLCYKI
jgi:hypothetical protein